MFIKLAIDKKFVAEKKESSRVNNVVLIDPFKWIEGYICKWRSNLFEHVLHFNVIMMRLSVLMLVLSEDLQIVWRDCTSLVSW